jgi:hypothetical protein
VVGKVDWIDSHLEDMRGFPLYKTEIKNIFCKILKVGGTSVFRISVSYVLKIEKLVLFEEELRKILPFERVRFKKGEIFMKF